VTAAGGPGATLGERQGYLHDTRIHGFADLAPHAFCYSVARGASVVRRGDLRRGIAVVVIVGELRMELGADSNGGERTLAVGWLRRGDFFDDTRILSRECQQIELRAVTPATVCSVPEDRIRELFNRSPAALMDWATFTAQRLEQTLQTADLAIFGTAEQRVIHELRRLAAASGELLEGGAIRVRRPSDAEMSMITATSRETVCRLRAAMVRRGLIVERPHHVLELLPQLMEEER
jgi:CRP-like cAMP-binding protein